MENIYTSEEYLQKNPSWHVEDSAWKANQIAKMLERNQINPQLIADLGCGAGEVLRQVAFKIGGDAQFHGYDISSSAIDLAKARETKQIKYFHKDFSMMDNVQYDLLLMIDIIEHIEDYFGFLRNVQTKGDLKILHIPLDLSVQSVFRESILLNWRENLGHIHFFNKTQALQMLEDLGYQVIDHFYTKTILELPQSTWLAKFSRLPIRLTSLFSEDLSARLFGGFSLLVLAR